MRVLFLLSALSKVGTFHNWNARHFIIDWEMTLTFDTFLGFVGQLRTAV